MNKTTTFFCAAAFAAVTAFPQAGLAVDAIAYHGIVADAKTGAYPSTHTPFSLEFRLYAAQSGGTALWGRLVPVKIQNGGIFYVELKDTTGSKLSGMSYEALADATAASPSGLWISLKPVDGTETSRERISVQPFAFHATAAAKTEALSAGTLSIAHLKAETTSATATVDTLSAGSFTKSSGATFSASPNCSITLSPSGSFTLSGPISGITITGDRGIPASASDTFLLRNVSIKNVGNSYSALVFPAGSSIGGEGDIVKTFTFGE